MEDYRNIICPSCGGKIWEHGNSAFHCQRLRRNVCTACCKRCASNVEWKCLYGLREKARRMDYQAAAERILFLLRWRREQEKDPAESESDGSHAANVQRKLADSL